MTMQDTVAPVGRRIVREPERYARTGYSRVQWWRLEAKGRVPRRVRLGENAVGWFADEIDAWLAERAAERDRAA